MSNRYSSIGIQTALGTADDFMLAVTGGTGVVVEIYHIFMSTEGTPIDEMITWSAFKVSTKGTGDDIAPEPLDAIRALAAEADATEEHTADPTIVGRAMFEVPVHSRATFQWQVPPGVGMGFISALAADDGYACAGRAPTYTAIARATMFHEE